MKYKIVLLVFLSVVGSRVFANKTDSQSMDNMFSEYSSWTYHLGYVYQIGDNGQLEVTDNLNRTDIEYRWSISDSDWLYVEGTKAKNGKTYAILKFKRLSFDTLGGLMYFNWGADLPETPNKTFEISIREEKGKVYVDRDEYMSLLSNDSYWHWVGRDDYLPYEQTEDGELVLYDFTMNVGDKYPSVPGHEDVIVVGTEKTKTLDGNEHRVILLSNGLRIVEGIGCLNSNGAFLFYLNSAGIEQAVEDLVLFSKGTIFNDEDKTILFDQHKNGDLTMLPWQPTTAIKTPVKTTNKAETSIYGLGGRELKSTPASGIYIRNGKKYVVK